MKSRIVFVCANCDAWAPKWSGRCLQCGQWNTLVEQSQSAQDAQVASVKPLQPLTLNSVKDQGFVRYSSGLEELDQIFGGEERIGIVPGSLILLGGDPGIGKSTLALQLALIFSQKQIKTLYVSGEESLPQIKLRAARLSKKLDELLVISENNLEAVLATVDAAKPRFLVIDSIQTMFSATSSGVAGGVAQVSAATMRIMEFIKSRHIATLLIGHVTKEGNLAGPKLLEHMVDVVLYLEGERYLAYRLLRCVKNRFGPTDEAGVMEMTSTGLDFVASPSQIFLSQRVLRKPGAVVTCALEGSRPLLLEIQALTSRSQFNYPKRAATGFDINRLQLLTAVLAKRLRLALYEQDVFVSVAGGFRINEPGCDLAVGMSILSSLKDFVAPADMAVLGEIGLSGEIRAVSQIDRRVAEAAKLGFKKVLVPAASRVKSSKVKLLPAEDLQAALKLVSS